MAITPTLAFSKIAEMRRPIRVVQGGTSAGKTYSILQYLIIYALNNTVLISIVAENIPVIKRGVQKDFFDILNSMDLYNESNHNKTDRTYQLGNSTFEFFGVEDASKLRGSRRDILFINEGNNISYEAFQELNVRTKKFTFIDYNPTAPFWATTDLVGQEDVDFLIVTYQDNEFLDGKIVKEIESWREKAENSDYWANRWKVMGLGQMGMQSGAIIQDWREIEQLPMNAQLLGSGLDFGFSQDPTSLISVYKYNDEIIVDEVIYQKGLLNSQIANLIKSSDAKGAVIYADSAEPKTIAELKSYGLQVLPVVKGRDSITYGLQLMQEQPFKVTSRSHNLIKELQNYTWAKDREGNPQPFPIENWNHGIDALRYFFLSKMGKKSTHFSLKWRR